MSEILVKDNTAIGVKFNNGEILYADKIIIATGGMSYKNTGSNGEGYKIVQKLGHTITNIKPSLVPITANGESLKICKEFNEEILAQNESVKNDDRVKFLQNSLNYFQNNY